MLLSTALLKSLSDPPPRMASLARTPVATAVVTGKHTAPLNITPCRVHLWTINHSALMQFRIPVRHNHNLSNHWSRSTKPVLLRILALCKNGTLRIGRRKLNNRCLLKISMTIGSLHIELLQYSRSMLGKLRSIHQPLPTWIISPSALRVYLKDRVLLKVASPFDTLRL